MQLEELAESLDTSIELIFNGLVLNAQLSGNNLLIKAIEALIYDYKELKRLCN